MATELPQSTALMEATGDSLAELFNRDPEGYSRQDLDRIIQALRSQRERLALAEMAPRAPRAPKAPKAPNLTSPVNATDLDL